MPATYINTPEKFCHIGPRPYINQALFLQQKHKTKDLGSKAKAKIEAKPKT
jgi:hypothetical protein